ncbi:MAG: DUF4097 family beta strand repeat-containing protein [Bryobacteraceae bacterium]
MLRLLIAALACASFLLAVDQEDHVRKSASVSSATRLILSADFGSIHVQPGNTKTVDVDVSFHGFPLSRSEFDRMRHDFTLDVTQQGSEIRVAGAFHKGWVPIIDFIPIILGGQTICHDWKCLEYGRWLRDVEYRVTVPEKFNADIQTDGGPIWVSDLNGELNARTSGGPITLEGGQGRAVVHTSGGPIAIKKAGGDVDASTSGGPISITGNLGRVRAHTSGGGIWIKDAAGAIDASTSGGPVSASIVRQPKEECRLSTSGGGIDVTLSRDIHVDLDASTSGGRVWTDFSVPYTDERHQSQLRAPLNGGGPLLYLHTSGGGISVRRAGGGRDLGPVF